MDFPTIDPHTITLHLEDFFIPNHKSFHLLKLETFFKTWQYLAMICVRFERPHKLVVIELLAFKVALLKTVTLWEVGPRKGSEECSRRQLSWRSLVGDYRQPSSVLPSSLCLFQLPLPLSGHLPCFRCYSLCHSQQTWDNTSATPLIFQNWRQINPLSL